VLIPWRTPFGLSYSSWNNRPPAGSFTVGVRNRYRFLVNDRSSIHDFHLTGPGLNRMLTTVDFTGTKGLVLTLRRGIYRYFCDPHASVMHGSFRVV
jgi:plastocyanin